MKSYCYHTENAFRSLLGIWCERYGTEYQCPYTPLQTSCVRNEVPSLRMNGCTPRLLLMPSSHANEQLYSAISEDLTTVILWVVKLCHCVGIMTAEEYQCL